DLNALFRRLLDILELVLDILFFDLVDRHMSRRDVVGLDEAGFDDSGHKITRYRTATNSRSVSSIIETASVASTNSFWLYYSSKQNKAETRCRKLRTRRRCRGCRGSRGRGPGRRGSWRHG